MNGNSIHPTTHAVIVALGPLYEDLKKATTVTEALAVHATALEIVSIVNALDNQSRRRADELCDHAAVTEMPFDLYRLPGGREVRVDATASKGAYVIGFTLESGAIVDAILVKAAEAVTR